MAYVKMWVHCVWGTKNHVPILINGKKYDIITHIRTNAESKGIYIDFVNGHSEHLHCLLLLRCDYTLSFVMQMIKGESSHWINKNKMIKGKFEWADEYYGASVSEADVKNVREYIKNQEEHHRIRTWEEEFKELLEECGFSEYKG